MQYLVKYSFVTTNVVAGYPGTDKGKDTDTMLVTNDTSFNDAKDSTSACSQILILVPSATNFVNKTILNGQIQN